MNQAFFRKFLPCTLVGTLLLIVTLFCFAGGCFSPPFSGTTPFTGGTDTESETTAILPPEETTVPNETAPASEETTTASMAWETTAPPETTPLLEERTETYDEIIPYGVQTFFSDALYEGEQLLLCAGTPGIYRITERILLEDGCEVARTVLEEVLIPPQDEMIQLGTRSPYREELATERSAILPSTTEYINDDTAYDDESEQLSGGVDGYELRTYALVYYKEVLSERILVKTEIVEPIPARVRVGTRPAYTEKIEVSRESPVSYRTRYENDASLDEGTTRRKAEGAPGYTEVTYRITCYHGEEIGREKVAERLIAPQEEVILVGTKKKEETFGMPFVDAAHGGIDYRVTQNYGGSNSHGGMDFGVYYGAPIIASMSGTVIYAYNEGDLPQSDLRWTYGTFVVIEHANGTRTYYAHLKNRTVSVGASVQKGEVIGYSGNTGRVSPAPTANAPLAGTHLHFEIRVWNGSTFVKTDPAPYLTE